MPKPPIWVDNNLLVNAFEGDAAITREFVKFHADGHEVLMTKATELEFLHGQNSPTSRTVSRQNFLKSMDITVDSLADQVPISKLRAWREAAMNNHLKPSDANVMAQVKAGAQARGINDPIFYTNDGRDLVKMRQTGVQAIEWKTGVPRPELGPPMPPTPTAPGSGPEGGAGSGSGAGSSGGSPGGTTMGSKVSGFISRRLSNWKAGIKAGLEGVLTPEGIAAAMPDLMLAIGDRAAASQAIKNIEITFIKSGFGRGVCAGIMDWIEEEVEAECMNQVTQFRVKDMEDPAGLLTLDLILKLAENYENYGVGVGFLWSKEQPQSWKEDIKSDGKALLKKYNYYWPTNTPSVFFTYKIIDELAFVLRHRTDAIVERSMRFHDSYSETTAWWKIGD